MRNIGEKKFTWLALFLAAGLLASCSAVKPNLPAPETLALPKPILDSTGRYLSPYTQDEVLAEWVDKSPHAKIGSFLGRTACLLLAVATNPPPPKKKGRRRGPGSARMVHGLMRNQIASKVGDQIGRDLAIETIGGWAYIRKHSDVSFNSMDNMIVYLYIKYSKTDHYKNGISAASTIYPRLEKRYYAAIRNARRK